MPSKEEIKYKILAKKGVLKPKNGLKSKHTFIVYSTYGEIFDLAERLQDEGNEVLMYIPDDDYKRIGDGIVDKTSEWYRCIGKGYIWVS